MVSKKRLSDTKKLAINRAIDLMASGKLTEAIETISKQFSRNSDTYLFFRGWRAQLENNHTLAIRLFEQSLLKNPLKEDALIGLAGSYSELGDYSRARECAEQALLLSKHSAQALLTLGTIISKSDSKNTRLQHEALGHLTRALDIATAENEASSLIVLDTMIAIGACYLNLKMNQQALLALETVVSIDKFNVVAHKNLASVYANLRMITEAIESCRIAQMTDSAEDKADALYQEGMLQLMSENYAKGWRLHEYRLQTSRYKHHDLFRGDTLNYEALTEHDSVLLFQEQGIGDFLQFSRYIPIIAQKTKSIDIVVFPNSYLTIRQEIPSLKSFVRLNYGKYIRNIYVKSVDSIPDDYSYSASLMSLPYILKTREYNIPPILPFVTDKKVEIKGTKLIALFYRGSPHHSNDANRSMPIEYVKQLIEQNADLTFVNMQLENELSEYQNVVHPHTEGLENMLAVLQQCNLLISVDSMIVHLAGGAGIATIVAHAYSSDWRWGIDRADSAWYPSILNIRQNQINDWHSVIEKIQQHLNSVKK